MSFLLKTGTIAILIGLFCSALLLAQSQSKPTVSVESGSSDSLNFLVFDTEQDFGLFIRENRWLADNEASFPKLDSGQMDSLFLVLNRDKKLIIPKAYLSEFSEFELEEPALQKIMVQSLDLIPKDKQIKYSFELKEGDHFFLRFDPIKGGGYGTGIEVLFNAVRVSEEVSLYKKKEFSLDFLATLPGTVEVVFRNFGFFKIQGEISVEVKPRKEKIKVQEDRSVQVYKKERIVSLKDTLYKTLFDEPIVITHRLNLKGNSVFIKHLELLPDRNLLGFAIFLYPYIEKEKLEFQRREIYREDPLQDFALKELIGRSYTYLPEFDLPDLDLSVVDFTNKNYWTNGETKILDRWESSPNSKSNYAFFKSKVGSNDFNFHVKVSNLSGLYNHEMGLQIVALFEDSFTVSESVDVQESEEIIIITLL